jgi:hypothetical protein
MTQMIKRQVSLSSKQNDIIKRRARSLGISEPELIRRGLQNGVESLTFSERDPRAWKRQLAFIRRRLKLPTTGGARTWTREDLYADRLRGGSG